EPAKWVARLRATKTDRNPLLFKINMEPAGHGGASGRYDKLRDTAYDYAWLLTQLSHSAAWGRASKRGTQAQDSELVLHAAVDVEAYVVRRVGVGVREGGAVDVGRGRVGQADDSG